MPTASPKFRKWSDVDQRYKTKKKKISKKMLKIVSLCIKLTSWMLYDPLRWYTIDLKKQKKNRNFKKISFAGFFFFWQKSEFFLKNNEFSKFWNVSTRKTISRMVMTRVWIVFSFSWTFWIYTLYMICTHQAHCIKHWKTEYYNFQQKLDNTSSWK